MSPFNPADYFSRSTLRANPTELPPQVLAAFTELGHAQRNKPEAAMVRAQHAMGGGVLGVAIEHTGDLTHRMTHMIGWGHAHGAGYSYVREKVTKVLYYMRNAYGFRREVEENFRANAKYREVPLSEYMADVNKVLADYATEHKHLTVYNRAQWLARQAAIELGLKKYDNAEFMLSRLEPLLKTRETWDAAATEYRLRPSGEVLRYEDWPENQK